MGLPPASCHIHHVYHLLKYTLCICRVLTRYPCRRDGDVLNRVDHTFLKTLAVLLQALDGLDRLCPNQVNNSQQCHRTLTTDDLRTKVVTSDRRVGADDEGRRS